MMKNIYVIPTVKEHTGNKTVYVKIMQGKKVRERGVARKSERGDTFWMKGWCRAGKEVAVNGGIRSYLTENEWTKSSKVASEIK